MGRPLGARSHDYEEKRTDLADRLLRALLTDANMSLRGLAEFAGVSRPTVLHYFGDRDGAVRAALERGAELGTVHVEHVRAWPITSARETLWNALRYVVDGWRDYQVGNLHYVGIQVGLGHGETATCYVRHALEPLVGALEGLLRRLVEEGVLRPHDPRFGALQLFGPLVLALLHQDGLGGRDVRELDVYTLLDQVIEGFVTAYGA